VVYKIEFFDKNQKFAQTVDLSDKPQISNGGKKQAIIRISNLPPGGDLLRLSGIRPNL
jgi:hypothetical protein